MPRYMCPAFGALSTHRTTSFPISKQDHWQNAPMQAAGNWIGRRDGRLALVAGAIGLTLGYLDAQPSWDDTGITAALLLLSSAMAAGLAGRGVGGRRPGLARGTGGLDPRCLRRLYPREDEPAAALEPVARLRDPASGLHVDFRLASLVGRVLD